MNKEEAKVIVAAGRIQAKVLELAENGEVQLPTGLAERIRENHEEIRGLLQAAIDSYEKKAKIAADFLVEAEEPLNVEVEDIQLELPFQQGQPAQEGQEPLTSDNWKIGIAKGDVLKRTILQKIMTGGGRTSCLEYCQAETRCNKAEATMAWDDLVRDGHIEKVGRLWTASELGEQVIERWQIEKYEAQAKELEAGDNAEKIQQLADGLASVALGCEVTVKLPTDEDPVKTAKVVLAAQAFGQLAGEPAAQDDMLGVTPSDLGADPEIEVVEDPSIVPTTEPETTPSVWSVTPPTAAEF